MSINKIISKKIDKNSEKVLDKEKAQRIINDINNIDNRIGQNMLGEQRNDRIYSSPFTTQYNNTKYSVFGTPYMPTTLNIPVNCNLQPIIDTIPTKPVNYQKQPITSLNRHLYYNSLNEDNKKRIINEFKSYEDVTRYFHGDATTIADGQIETSEKIQKRVRMLNHIIQFLKDVNLGTIFYDSYILSSLCADREMAKIELEYL